MKTEQLSDIDIQIIRSESERSKDTAIILIGVGLVAIIGTLIALILDGSPKSILYFVIATLVFLLLIVIANSLNSKHKRDLKLGIKEIIEGVVNDKYEHHYDTSVSYRVNIDGETFNLDVSSYVKAEIGKRFRIERSINGQVVLSADSVELSEE